MTSRQSDDRPGEADDPELAALLAAFGGQPLAGDAATFELDEIIEWFEVPVDGDGPSAGARARQGDDDLTDLWEPGAAESGAVPNADRPLADESADAGSIVDDPAHDDRLSVDDPATFASDTAAQGVRWRRRRVRRSDRRRTIGPQPDDEAASADPYDDPYDEASSDDPDEDPYDERQDEITGTVPLERIADEVSISGPFVIVDPEVLGEVDAQVRPAELPLDTPLGAPRPRPGSQPRPAADALGADVDDDFRYVGWATPSVDPTDAAAVQPERIVIVDDPSLPDTVYLDEEKDRRFHQIHRVEGDTIYIDDLDAGAGSEERAPRSTARSGVIDPRLRARRVAVKRAEGRRRLVWVAGVVATVAVVVGGVTVVASPVFDVRDVVVQGAVYTDTDVLEAVIADLEGTAVLLVDTDAVARRLESVPWVERARVDADFPHTVVIDLRERRPLAAFRGGDGQWRVIDVEGRVLDVLTGQPVAYVPITGDHPDTARGQFAGAPYATAAGLVNVLPAEVRVITRSVGLDAVTGTLTMELAGSGGPASVAVRLGSPDDLGEKLARLLGQIRSGLAGVVALDVSTPQIGVVRG